LHGGSRSSKLLKAEQASDRVCALTLRG